MVNVWNVDSGNPVARLSNCHGKDEITAMNLDNKGRRLITGSRAGDIKVIIDDIIGYSYDDVYYCYN